MENKMPKKITVFKIVGTALYALTTIAMAIILIWSIPQNDSWDKLGYVLVVIVFCLCALLPYVASTVLGVLGLVYTKKQVPEEKKKGNKIYFVLMMVLPLVTDALFFSTLFLL